MKTIQFTVYIPLAAAVAAGRAQYGETTVSLSDAAVRGPLASGRRSNRLARRTQASPERCSLQQQGRPQRPSPNISRSCVHYSVRLPGISSSFSINAAASKRPEPSMGWRSPGCSGRQPCISMTKRTGGMPHQDPGVRLTERQLDFGPRHPQ